MNPFPTITWANTVTVTDFNSLQNEISIAGSTNTATEIIVSNDINFTAGQTLIVPAGATIYIGSGEDNWAIDASGSGNSIMEVQTGSEGQETTVYFGRITLKGGTGQPNGGVICSTGNGDAIIVLEYRAVFELSTATNGGAIYLAKGAVGVFGGGLLGDNHAYGNGGAIYILEGHSSGQYEAFYMDGTAGAPSAIYDNVADGDGGGVYIRSSTDGAVISHGGFYQNHAQGFGGALNIRKLEIANTHLNANTADAGGGAVYIDGPGAIGEGANFEANSTNTAAAGGGAIYLGRSAAASLYVRNGAAFNNNEALGSPGGGAIYLTRAQLPALTVTANVTFVGNSAQTGVLNRNPIDDAVYIANIGVADGSWSTPYTLQGYNNFDIAYNAEAPEPEVPCEVEGEQLVDICLPVSVEPYARVGTITTRCCGVAIITPGTNTCDGEPLGRCDFTIRQKVCVNVPVAFGATVETGDAHMICSEDGCADCPPPADAEQ